MITLKTSLSLWIFILTGILFTTHASGKFDSLATPIESISVREGFKVELLFTVPKNRMGS